MALRNPLGIKTQISFAVDIRASAAATQLAKRWPESLLTLQETGCTEHICIGSIMLPPQHTRRPEDVRTKGQLFPLAKEFLDQYYSSIKRQVCVNGG